MIELRQLHETRVSEDQIDNLGHMNVRFYLELALHATRTLAATHGLSWEACHELGGVLEVRDVFTRHYREQLAGAPLVVMGGVLAVHADGLRIYHELLNHERDERAAVFVHEVSLRKREDRRPLPLPEMLAKSASDALVSWPEHGRPRTLDLERGGAGPSLELVRERGLAMRRERVLRAEECDSDGFFAASRYQELVWGGEPLVGRMSGVPVFDSGDGGKFGWASLESRGTLHHLPRAGARIQSFGAEVGRAAKTSTRHHWVFDLDSAQLLCTNSIVNLAFDLTRRRAIEIPKHVRATLDTQYHPDLC